MTEHGKVAWANNAPYIAFWFAVAVIGSVTAWGLTKYHLELLRYEYPVVESTK